MNHSNESETYKPAYSENEPANDNINAYRVREILFRAKAINRDKMPIERRTTYKNGEWVYGLISKLYDSAFHEKFLPAEMTNEKGISGIEVDYKTIGQYTGQVDKNGSKIFEGDVVEYNGTLHEVVYCTVNGCAFFGITMPERGEIWNFNGITPPSKMIIVGSIYDEIKGGFRE